MDTIFTNGNILTMEDKTPHAGAVAVQFGRVCRIGDRQEIENLAVPTTELIDLKGQTLLPGFIDTHNHFSLYALLIDQADCRPTAGCAVRRCAGSPPGKSCKYTAREMGDGLGVRTLFA